MDFPERRYFSRLGAEQGFHVDAIEKVYRLMAILMEIGEHPLLRESLALKGGTAINFLYFNHPRLSVDIDLDYVGEVEREEMLADREVIAKTLGRIYRSSGYQEDRRDEHLLLQSILWYTNAAGNRGRINVEINFGLRVPVLNTMRRQVVHFFDLPLVSVRTLQPDELFAAKIVALLDRQTPRDLFDVHMLTTRTEVIRTNVLRRLVVFFSCIATDDARRTLKNDIVHITQRNVRNNLFPMLRKRVDWDHPAIITGVKEFLAPIVAWFPESEEFIDRFYQGEYVPRLLFHGIQVNDQIQSHPVAAWKTGKIMARRE